ncbi:MAG: glycerophosphatase, partial [Nitriliruptorales bacterium]|nr:glycerophosphatase [Nitriliruptorales bacterium]
RNRTRVLGVAGGDGTVTAVAAVAAAYRTPLVVVPAGTLNRFARDVGLTSADDSAHALVTGSAVHVDLATVQVDGGPQRWFINTASFGDYPNMVRLREKWQQRWGKWPAAAAALITVLAHTEPLTVRIGGVNRKIWLLFVGNGAYHPRGFTPSWRPRLDSGVLDIRYVRADLPFSRTRFAIAAVTGALLNSRTYVQEVHDRIRIDALGEPIALACDGEAHADGHVFNFAAHEEAIRVYRPPDPDAQQDANA